MYVINRLNRIWGLSDGTQENNEVLVVRQNFKVHLVVWFAIDKSCLNIFFFGVPHLATFIFVIFILCM
jgi:hypothetical protein